MAAFAGERFARDKVLDSLGVKGQKKKNGGSFFCLRGTKGSQMATSRMGFPQHRKTRTYIGCCRTNLRNPSGQRGFFALMPALMVVLGSLGVVVWGRSSLGA